MSPIHSNCLPQGNLYSAKTVRELDRIAIEDHGISAVKLMKRAGGAAFDALLKAFGRPQLLTVFCGAGNNGGDGYIIAALAVQKNIPVQVIELAGRGKLSADAERARQFAEQANVIFTAYTDKIDLAEGVIVDALLGTGFKAELRTPYSRAIHLINDSRLPVLSVDLPSGLNADTGGVADVAVKADVTVTFVAAKQGLFSARGPALCGEVIYCSLDIPSCIFQRAKPSAQLMDLSDLLRYLPEPEADVHKNQRGHSLIIGGDRGYGGAVAMAAEACLKVGSGMVSVATRAEHVAFILARQPEVMASGVISAQELELLLDRPNVLVVGPGLGRSAWSEQLLQKAVAARLPMVLDADALNMLAEGAVVSNIDGLNGVLTPHPGEAARLLNISVAEVQADRFKAVQRLQRKYNAVVLLKGSGTLIASADQVIKLCPYGNPAMATAGMGDLLSGMIGGLIAQGLGLQVAAQLGCCLHSAAADKAAQERGPRGLVATDLLPYVGSLLNQVSV